MHEQADAAFFAAIKELFERFPEQRKKYGISSKKMFHDLLDEAGEELKLVARRQGRQIVIAPEAVADKDLELMGCCQWCSEEDVVYCCVSSPDC